MISRRPLAALTLGVGLLFTAACGGEDAEEATAPATTPGEGGSESAGGASTVAIKGFKFAPADLTVEAGQPLQVVNEDDVPHTLTAADDSFDTGELSGGEEAELTIEEPGEHPYICEIHQYMRGTVTVR